VNCAAGTYSSVDASISCTNCASGKTSNSGATSCTASGDDDTVTDDTPLDDSTDDVVGDDDDGAYHIFYSAYYTHTLALFLCFSPAFLGCAFLFAQY